MTTSTGEAKGSETGRFNGRGGVDRPVLSYGEFARELDRASRTLWCIAAAIVRDRTEAEDVVQEAAVIGLSKIEQFDPGTSFTAWMGSIVRFVALNESRRRTRRNLALADPVTLDAANEADGAGKADAKAADVISSGGELLMDQSAFDDEVLEALSALEETARACLLLRTLVDLPYREISLALGIPEGTAMSHVHRARAAMRKRLGGEETPAGNEKKNERGEDAE